MSKSSIQDRYKSLGFKQNIRRWSLDIIQFCHLQSMVAIEINGNLTVLYGASMVGESTQPTSIGYIFCRVHLAQCGLILSCWRLNIFCCYQPLEIFFKRLFDPIIHSRGLHLQFVQVSTLQSEEFHEYSPNTKRFFRM